MGWDTSQQFEGQLAVDQDPHHLLSSGFTEGLSEGGGDGHVELVCRVLMDTLRPFGRLVKIINSIERVQPFEYQVV